MRSLVVVVLALATLAAAWPTWPSAKRLSFRSLFDMLTARQTTDPPANPEDSDYVLTTDTVATYTTSGKTIAFLLLEVGNVERLMSVMVVG
ncbi:hypothetical protein K402DRAFT_392745 [Aulographum hederae CBS 113979]|uniref:Uncharacterized protein n=1 Tax=Aulographum hederae CBS 113979 TaxID=1176131 RepID=A0A6G1H2P1_9PEZI|nr:hypothetical protein K402DRAFT_392745 [Aulographum hederae CBS 113979]